jgi:peroxiredoxin family protein
MSDMIVPSFGNEEDSGRKLAIICSKGSLDMAYPAFILGNAALGEGIAVDLFFTFWGFDIINNKTMDHLKFSPVGNTATHMPAALSPLPGVTAFATHSLKKSLAELDVPEVRDFLDLLKDSGANIWACQLSADMNHLVKEDLYEGVDAIINASAFIEMTDGAQLLFI